jgi:hypothetical protein
LKIVLIWCTVDQIFDHVRREKYLFTFSKATNNSCIASFQNVLKGFYILFKGIIEGYKSDGWQVGESCTGVQTLLQC